MNELTAIDDGIAINGNATLMITSARGLITIGIASSVDILCVTRIVDLCVTFPKPHWDVITVFFS